MILAHRPATTALPEPETVRAATRRSWQAPRVITATLADTAINPGPGPDSSANNS